MEQSTNHLVGRKSITDKLIERDRSKNRKCNRSVRVPHPWLSSWQCQHSRWFCVLKTF